MDIESLKCCGNCLHRKYLTEKDFYRETCSKGKGTSGFEYCEQWKFDCFTRSIRENRH